MFISKSSQEKISIEQIYWMEQKIEAPQWNRWITSDPNWIAERRGSGEQENIMREESLGKAFEKARIKTVYRN